MEPEEIARRLQEVRDRIRAELSAAAPPRVGADLSEPAPLALDEAELPALAREPNLNSTPALERANQLERISGPIEITTRLPVIGPLVTFVRRLARPLVRPFIDPYIDRQERFNAEVVRHLNELGQRLEKRLDRIWNDLIDRAADPRLLEARLEAALSDYDTALRQRHVVLFDSLEQELWALRDLVSDGSGGVGEKVDALEVRFVERAQAVDRRFDEKDRALDATLGEVAADILAQATRSRAVSLPEAELMAARSLLREALDATGQANSKTNPDDTGPSGSGGPAERFDAGLQARLREWMADEDYRAFQDQFRGDPDEIRNRLERHLETFRDAPGPVADLGCGRGEFLDLLAAAKIEAIGVEINAADVEECRRRGLEATTADLFDWLEARSPASLGGIFLAQVIEHLPPPDWSRFIELAATRLAPGGVLVVETINPESLYALGRAYVLDPTHTRPVHPDLLAFFATRAGFATAEVRFQASVPDDVRIALLDEATATADPELVRQLNRRIGRINEICCAPQEYALVARRGSGGEKG